MAAFKRHLVAAILSMSLALTLTACDSEDDPGETTPNDTGTTQPVGS